MKVIGITGGAGFIGRHISQRLKADGHEVIVFTRKPRAPAGGIQFSQWNSESQTIDRNALATVDAMIHLAGAGVMDKRWTPAYKREIIRSRVAGTHFLHEQLAQYGARCRSLVAASAIGYYGPDRHGATIPFIETAAPYHDFLAGVCVQWEAAIFAAQSKYRTVALRIGIVLGRDGGAFPKLVQPMGFGIVPILGSGMQMVSWIHIRDLAAIFAKSALDEAFGGIYNAVAPNPVTHKALMLSIAAANGGLKFPIHIPGAILKIIIGEASTEVLKSCAVSDARILAAGYRFSFPEIEFAAAELATKEVV